MILRSTFFFLLLLGSVWGQHEDQHLCNIDAECPVKSCMDAACVKDVCVYKEVICESPGDDDSCLVSLGCQVESSQCVYQRLDCDDYNFCTEDICARDDFGAAYCAHTHVKNCEERVEHAVVFHNSNDWQLRVKEYHDENVNQVELCHTTAYLYEEDRSVVVLGFSTYEQGQLTERGTCDNLINGGKENDFNDNLWHIVSSQESSTDSECRMKKDGEDLTLEGVFSPLFWQEATSRFVDLGGGRVHLHGQAHGVNVDDGFAFTVDVYMDRNPLYQSIIALPAHCYENMNIDVGAWLGYQLVRGQLVAASKSLYDGLIIELVWGSMQTGYGASSASLHHGFSAEFTWRVVHQPHNMDFQFSEESRVGSMHGDFSVDYKDSNTLSYCDLFEDRGASLESDKWSSSWMDDHTITYCSNFSVDDLLRCRGPHDEYASLFTRQTDSEYSYIRGQLYHTVVQQPWDCEHPRDTEKTMSRTIFDVDIRMDPNDASFLKMNVVTPQPNFAVSWVGNTWLCCSDEDAGELKIELETRSPEGRELIDARVVFEKGTHMQFIEDRVGCTIDVEGYCIQRWSLRSYSQGMAETFSDMKILAWTSMESGLHATVYMTVDAMHVGIQDHFYGDSRVSVTSGLYTNRAFTDVYDATKHSLLDGAQLFAMVCLNEHRHLDLSIREVSICSSESGNDWSSCYEEGVDRTAVYSIEDDVQSPYNFEILRDPPSTTHCEGFSITVRTRSKGRQRIFVQWATEEVGGHGGLIELFDDDHDDPHHIHDDSSQYFLSRCPSGWFYDHDERECRLYEHHDGLSALWVLIGFVVFIIVLCFSFRWCHTFIEQGHDPYYPPSSQMIQWPRTKDEVVPLMNTDNL